MRYCESCDQDVTPERNWSWAAFIGWMILGGLGILYPFYYFLKSKRCPICNGKNWKR